MLQQVTQIDHNHCDSASSELIFTGDKQPHGEITTEGLVASLVMVDIDGDAKQV